MKISESDIATATMGWLSNMEWNCYPEAQFTSGGKRADIAAVRGSLLWIVECKVSAGLALLEQAVEWVGSAHYVSVAVPSMAAKGSRIFRKVCAYYGIGIFLTGKRADYAPEHIHMIRTPKLNRSANRIAVRLIGKLDEDMKLYIPGSVSKDGYSTPWNRTMRDAVNMIQRNPGIDLKRLIESIDHHYHSGSTAKQCLKDWLDKDARVEMQRDGRRIVFYPVTNQVNTP